MVCSPAAALRLQGGRERHRHGRGPVRCMRPDSPHSCAPEARCWCLNPAADMPGCASGFSAGEAGERLQTAIAVARKSHLNHRRDDRHRHPRLATRHPRRTRLRPWSRRREAADEPALPNRESSGDFPLVLAVDTPSGVGVNDGSLPGPYIPATVTVTFGAMKPCAVLPPATFACGRIELLDFGSRYRRQGSGRRGSG